MYSDCTLAPTALSGRRWPVDRSILMKRPPGGIGHSTGSCPAMATFMNSAKIGAQSVPPKALSPSGTGVS